MGTAEVAGVDISTAHFIDGKRVASQRTFADCSPIDGTHLAAGRAVRRQPQLGHRPGGRHLEFRLLLRCEEHRGAEGLVRVTLR